MSDFSDVSDRATLEEQRSLEAAVEVAKQALAHRKYQPRGCCHNCNEAFPAGDERIFCDSDCATDHERLRLNEEYRHGR